MIWESNVKPSIRISVTAIGVAIGLVVLLLATIRLPGADYQTVPNRRGVFAGAAILAVAVALPYLAHKFRSLSLPIHLLIASRFVAGIVYGLVLMARLGPSAIIGAVLSTVGSAVSWMLLRSWRWVQCEASTS